MWNREEVNPVYLAITSAVAAIWVLSSLLNKAATRKKPWPVVPGALPIVGNWMGGPDNFWDKACEWIVKYGSGENNKSGLLEINVFGNTFLIACNNRMASQIASRRNKEIQRFRALNEAVKSLGADGVFSAEGHVWRHDRRVVAPPLNRKNLRDYLPEIQKVTTRLIEKWQDASNNGPVTINGDLTSYTIDNIGLIAFAQDYDCLRRSDSREAIDLQFLFRSGATRMLSPIPYWKIPFIGQYLDGVGFRKDRIRAGFRKVLASHQNNKVKNPATATATTSSRINNTYLSKVLAMASSSSEDDDKRDNNSLSEDRIIGNLMTMFSAGSETTGTTIMMCLWQMLHDNTGLHEELGAEALAVHQHNNGLETATLEQILEGLPRIRSLFYEVVRYKGAAPMLLLEAVEPVKLEDSSFPKGTLFMLPFQYLGTLEDSGVPKGTNDESPAEFCPRRWLLETTTTDHPEEKLQTQPVLQAVKPSAKMGVHLSSGFGTGVRICPGQDLAEVEAVYCLASLLVAFHISLEPGHPPVKLLARTTMTPDINIRLVIQPRK